MARPKAALLLALGLAAALAAPPASAAGPVVEEDLARAFAIAKAKGALVLVDVWAPW